jgi:hypothetical protein
MSATAGTAAEGEQWISRADAAKLARRSEDTIKRAVADHNLETRPGLNGRVMLRVADLVRIGRISVEDVPAGASAAGSTAAARSAAAPPAATDGARAVIPAAARVPAVGLTGLDAEAAALVRLVGSVPVATPACDLIGFANADWAGLDPARDADSHTLAEATLSWFHTHVGVERRTGGECSADLVSDLQRYLLPFALEFDAAQHSTGAGRLRLQHAKAFITSISGGAPSPAATAT